MTDDSTTASTAAPFERPADVAMFPLGSVLFPHMPLQLRVFEERYLIMLSELIGADPLEFGTVLIERGQEVGGGEQRFEVGTIAQIVQLQGGEGMVGLLARGDRRVEVVEWMPENPYPRAVVRELPELVWNDELEPLWAAAEQTVRRAIVEASEFVEQSWPSDIQLSSDPVAAAWQLAAIAPIGSLDQLKLLRASSAEQLLTGLVAAVEEAGGSYGSSWPDTFEPDTFE